MSSAKQIERTMGTLSACVAQLQTENEILRGFLLRITRYESVAKLRRDSEKEWGLPFEEALEMAYENVVTEAKNGLAWKPTALTSKPELLGSGPIPPTHVSESESRERNGAEVGDSEKSVE